MDGLHSTGLAVLEGDGVEDLSRVVGDESDVGQDQLPLVVGRMAWVLREVLLHDEEGSRACGKWQQRVDNQLDLFHFLLILLDVLGLQSDAGLDHTGDDNEGSLDE